MTRRGWCPSVFAPMESGDGLLVRIKPPHCRLSPDQARTVAMAALRDGNGAIEIGSRASVQVRGLTDATVPRFARSMIAAGLVCADPGWERRRTVAVAPLAGEAVSRVGKVLSVYLADEALTALPLKFGFAVGLPGMTADVHLARTQAGWLVWPDGAGHGAASDDPATDAVRLAAAFLAVAPGARRMREAGAAEVFAAAGLRAEAPLPANDPPELIGPLPGGFGVGLPFGATDAATLAVLADVGALWVTPWRAVVVEQATAESLAELDLILDPADPRRAVSACPGRPACSAGWAETRAVAMHLAHRFPGLALHVSGCAKGCAHPAAAPVTLVAAQDGYALVRDGRAGDAPAATGLTLEGAAAMIAA